MTSILKGCPLAAQLRRLARGKGEKVEVPLTRPGQEDYGWSRFGF